LTLNSTFIRSIPFVLIISALEKMEIRLSKTQMVKAIDDGGVSMYFQCNVSSTRQSRRVILSVEVKTLPDKSTQNEKSTQKKK